MKGRALSTQGGISCPYCGHQNPLLRPKGNTIDVPLVCAACGRGFTPKFYCPDRKASQRHLFESRALYVDNLQGVYTFCPEHTFTTYDIAPPDGQDGRIPGMPERLRSEASLAQTVLGILSFRLALAIEGIRHRLSTVATTTAR